MKTVTTTHLPRSGAVELLFALHHGVGASGQHMAPLAGRLAAEYPQAAVVCLDGPQPFDAGAPGSGGFQWFSVQSITETNRPERVAQALPGFVAAVRALQQRFGVSWQCTALAGFSQGAIMALEAVQDKAIEQLRTFLPKKLWRDALGEAPVLARIASSAELGR